MKKTLLCIGLIYALQTTAQTTQVIDVSTGVTGPVGGGSLIPLGSPDDSWTFAQGPSGPPVTPRCAALTGYWSEPGCARWITTANLTPPPSYQAYPVLPGTYSYKMTFNANAGCVATAWFTFNKIGADDQIQSIKVNGNVHTINNYGFNPPASNITIPLTQTANSEINPGASNTIEVVVNNNGGQQGGLYLCGTLTIAYGPVTPTITTTTSTFCSGTPLTFSSTVVGHAASHFWEIAECDPSGNVTPGGYVWNNGFAFYQGDPGTYTFPSTLPIPCNKYYKIKLAALNQCSPWVESNKVIYITCGPSAIAGRDAVVCPGVPTSIGTRSAMMTTYSWSPATWLNNASSFDPTVTMPAGFTSSCPGSITYTLTATSMTTGCSNTDEVVVKYATAPTVASLSYQTNGNCDYNIDLHATSACSDVNYLWNTAPTPTAGANITVTPSVATLYSVQTSNVCFTNTQTEWVYPCFHPTGSFNMLRADAGVYVNWSGNYGQGGFRIFDNTVADWTGPAYNADWMRLTVYDRWGTATLFTQEEWAPCGGFWSGILIYGCIYNGQPLPSDVYPFKLERENCNNSDVLTGSFTVLGTKMATDGTSQPVVGNIRIDEGSRASIFAADAANTFVDFSVYPNPGTGVFTIEMNDGLNALVEVYDALGKKVKTIQQNGFKSVLDLTGLPKGMYLINVTSDGQLTSKKIVLQ